MGTIKTAPYWATQPIPAEHDLKLSFEVYRPSKRMDELSSEVGRQVYAEIFIENTEIGPLANLCVRVLAQLYRPRQLKAVPLIFTEPIKRRIYYNTLSVDLPLTECYEIDDEPYWRRVCMAKSHDKGLVLKKVDNWKELALSLKFVEIVENSPAEYWPEEELSEMMRNINGVIKDLHIRHLKLLSEHNFKHDDYAKDYGDTSSESSSSEEEPEPAANDSAKNNLEWEEEERVRRLVRKQEKKLHRESRLNRRKANKDRALAMMSMASRKNSAKGLTKRQLRRIKRQLTRSNRFDGVYDIPVDALDEDEAPAPPILDRRNNLLLFNELHHDKYPAEKCHHVPLSFIRHFKNLVSFSIEFNPPDLQREYHAKYFNFSNMDILHMAYGLRCLKKLKIFRLRNSRLDANKLYSLATSLETLQELEVVDFGFDQLKDDCDEAVEKLFGIPNLKSLELESNPIGAMVLSQITECIQSFSGELQYLGLARNTFEFQEMNAFCAAMVQSNQIVRLSLTGASISQKSIGFCIAQGLVKHSVVLKHLDLAAVHIGSHAARYLVSALSINTILLTCDVRASNMPYDIEHDIAMLCKRNQYIDKNSYVGESEKTHEQVEQCLGSLRNPIHARALQNSRRRTRQSTEFDASAYKYDLPTPRPSIWREFKPPTLDRSAVPSVGTFATATDASMFDLSYSTMLDFSIFSHADGSAFNYDPNDFDEKDFHKHALVPGPSDRYYFFQSKVHFTFFRLAEEIKKFDGFQRKHRK